MNEKKWDFVIYVFLEFQIYFSYKFSFKIYFKHAYEQIYRGFNYY